MQKQNKIVFTIVITLIITWLLPHWISPETATNLSQIPSITLPFGSYHNSNLLHIVLTAAQISLTISFYALVISTFLCLLILIVDFYVKFAFVNHILKVANYFPRLFILVFFSALLKLHETSQLSIPASFYLIIILGLSGTFFLLAQTYTEISKGKKTLYVHFACSLPISKYKIFLRHILRNSITFPISVAKQMRDNIMFIAVLPFTGVVHLQPEDLGGLIHKYFLQPDAFNEGWWILVFPCLFLVWLILVFDLLASHLQQRIFCVDVNVVA
ncbi:hypothetical protein [Candidatus Uabimicrobium sp. HlEnr_7]|uniref:hypothetical protein n=1 Tax=Candidatus Uabimicrobium helgolandensis TaxID=3095367 RepID=UPI0035565605